MSCEQVEAIVLDLYCDGATDPEQKAAALAHLGDCSRCAALQESWDAAKEELRTLAEETLDARAPARVEMRLLQEFRMQHRKAAARRLGVISAWALAAAALLVAGVTVWNARHPNVVQNGHQNLSATRNSPVDAAPQTAEPGELIAGLSGEDSSDFTPLPGATLSDTEDAAILRVRMQRGSLGALGLPYNEQRANEWIQVDLLVGTDGSPEGVRLAQEEN